MGLATGGSEKVGSEGGGARAAMSSWSAAERGSSMGQYLLRTEAIVLRVLESAGDDRQKTRNPDCRAACPTSLCD